jgi:hypothetical protein
VTFDNFVESVELGDIRMMIKLDVHVEARMIPITSKDCMSPKPSLADDR